MEEIDRLDKKIRNLALIIMVCGVLILTILIIFFLQSTENKHPYLIAIGIALLISGILLITRIQYIIWMKKKY
jgi:uncharacterized membrane protein YjjP (DUF1212 family)